MMSKATWADVKPGDVLELNGRGWSVVKIKPRGKKADVKVRFGKQEAKSTVKLSDRVRIIERRGAAAVKKSPVQDDDGTMQRWAKKKELEAVLGKGSVIPPGDAAVKKPPAKPAGGSWTKPVGKVEKILDDVLSARLVGESHDETKGYYIPPVDVSTVAAHLDVFHGGIPDSCDGEAEMLMAHGAQHDAAVAGEGILAINHWHTAKRP